MFSILLSEEDSADLPPTSSPSTNSNDNDDDDDLNVSVTDDNDIGYSSSDKDVDNSLTDAGLCDDEESNGESLNDEN
jgi:hypothetical protein